MGAPGWTSFCKNGHIVETCPHHGIILDEKQACDLCGEPVIGTITEWGDQEYAPFPVPMDAIRYDEITIVVITPYGKRETKQRVPVFDVSRLRRLI